MPKNKGKGKNAFFFFMLDWKKRAEAKGRRFPNGLKDVQLEPECNAEWQRLTKQEKGSFEARAKDDKIASQISQKEKKTTLGEPLSTVEWKEKRKEMFLKSMKENIKLLIDSAINLNILPQLKFCFVHVNSFFKKIVNNTLEYFPAEYTFGIFSFQNGIEDVHHTIVSTKIPLGFRREALETSQNTHKIPIEYEGGQTDFAIMYKKLAEFLESRKLVDQYPYFYTKHAFVDEARSLIKELCNAAQQDKKQFKIYDLELLFEHLANELFKKRKDRKMDSIPVYAHRIFENYSYIFDKGFECHFHKYLDGGPEYCSKSILQQWAWILCNEFCEPLEIKMQPGVHYPDRYEPDTLSTLMSNLYVKDVCQSTSEIDGVLSMTGVSEQHRLKVSERTYNEKMRRRIESEPVKVVDYGEETANKSNDKFINKPTSKFTEIPIEKRTEYLNEKPLRAPKIDPRIYITCGDDLLPTDDENFPPIGGRGVSNRSRISSVRKAPLGRGQGHA